MIHHSLGTQLRAFSIGLVLAAALPSSSRGEDSPTSAIRDVLDRQVTDWNRHDLDGFLNGYWHSPKVVFQSGGERSDGFDAMRDRYRKRYQGEGREMGRLEFQNVEIETLGEETGFARGRWQLTMSDGSRPGGLFTVILRKFPDGWKIVHDHTSADAPPAKPASAKRT
jgi:beta-aspartyl-peptidase (threonine type)